MNLAESVFETARKFTERSKYVDIDYNELRFVASDMKLEKPKKFPTQNDDSDEYKTCLLELIGDSINYCYWYGSSLVRPLGSCSGKMYELVQKAFENSNSLDECLDNLIKLLSLERFPLLEDRVRHLNELRLNAPKFIATVIKYKEDLEYLLNSMVQIFPGYASDIFLKRAFLFFCQLNRKFGWFEKDMYDIPVPSDYQVPKMLEYYGILKYDEDLKDAIENEVLIPKGSKVECEIRAATVVACRQLCAETGWSTPQVDGYFWLKRKEITSPFHLCVTSDY